MDSPRASFTGTECVSGNVGDHSWEIHARRLVLKAENMWASVTFFDRIHDSPETASKARIGDTCTSFAVRSLRIVVGDVSRRCSKSKVKGPDAYGEEGSKG